MEKHIADMSPESLALNLLIHYFLICQLIYQMTMKLFYRSKIGFYRWQLSKLYTQQATFKQVEGKSITFPTITYIHRSQR